MTDQFPEAFRRLEIPEDARNFTEFRQLKALTVERFGDGWIDSANQNRALRIEADKLGIPYSVSEIRREIFGEKPMVRVQIRGTYAQLQQRQVIIRAGKKVTVYRDARGKFTKKLNV